MRAAEKKHMDKVAQLGCIVCRNLGFPGTPPQIHHIRTGMGMGQRASNYRVIPLCMDHHLTGGKGVALHADRKTHKDPERYPPTWVDIYGTEEELLAQVLELIK